jgi:hypothetical protein
MVKSLGLALLAGAFVVSTAGAALDPDVSALEFKCQNTQVKAGVKFTGCKAKCVSKCIAGARKVPPLNPEADCFPPFGGATLTCIADALKGCEAKGIAAINKGCLVLDPLKTDCPECYSARGGGPDCSGHAEDVIVDGLSNPASASLETQIDAFGFVFCNDNDSNPPQTAAEDKCEQATAKTLVKFVGCKNRCYTKCQGGISKNTIPNGDCSPPSPNDAATFACLFDPLKGCEAKAIAALDKACVTAPADQPECYSHTSSSIVALVETAIDGNIGTGNGAGGNYCGSPSGAFLAD